MLEMWHQGVLRHSFTTLRQQGVNDILAAYVQVYLKKNMQVTSVDSVLYTVLKGIRANFNRVSFYLKNIFWECISVYFETSNSGENQDKNKKNNNLVEIKLFVFIYLNSFQKNLGSGGGFLIYFIQCICCSISTICPAGS